MYEELHLSLQEQSSVTTFIFQLLSVIYCDKRDALLQITIYIHLLIISQLIKH